MKTFKKYITEAFDFREGDKVRVPHRGKMVQGKIVRYDKGDPHGSPFYVVYVGEYESIKVPAHDVEKFNEEVDIAQKKRVVIDMDEDASEKSTVEKAVSDWKSKNPGGRIIKSLVPGENPSRIHVFCVDHLGNKRELGSYQRVGQNMTEDASEDFERAKKELDNKKTEFKKKADLEKDRAKEQEFKEKQKESEQEFQEKQREDKQKREQKYKEQEDKKRDQERQQQAKKATAATSESIEDKFNKEFLIESANPTREELMKELRVLNSRLPIDVAVSTLEKKYNCRIVIPSGTFISHVKFN